VHSCTTAPASETPTAFWIAEADAKAGVHVGGGDKGLGFRAAAACDKQQQQQQHQQQQQQQASSSSKQAAAAAAAACKQQQQQLQQQQQAASRAANCQLQQYSKPESCNKLKAKVS